MPTVKEQLHHLVDLCNDELLLEEAKAILETSPTGDWWDELSAEDKNRVQESEQQYERKEFVTHSELMKRFEEWKKK
jgi:hypothetical protein